LSAEELPQADQEEDLSYPAFEIQALADTTQQALLSQHDFSTLWMTDQQAGVAVYNGFYGPDHYRIEICFASITRDSLLPQRYYVQGKSRYKKNILPFWGIITLDSMAALHRSASNQDEGKDEHYLVCGQFTLQEDSIRLGAGQFKGKLFLECRVAQQHNLQLAYSLKTPTHQAGFLFEGEWCSYRTATRKPVLWADNFFAVADDVLENFNLGERDVEINPKYRHLGWDSYWSQEEWWNEPGPILQ
jgi:hypothetical protein